MRLFVIIVLWLLIFYGIYDLSYLKEDIRELGFNAKRFFGVLLKLIIAFLLALFLEWRIF